MPTFKFSEKEIKNILIKVVKKELNCEVTPEDIHFRLEGDFEIECYPYPLMVEITFKNMGDSE